MGQHSEAALDYYLYNRVLNAKARRARKQARVVGCKYCNANNLRWINGHRGKWVLVEADGKTPHDCIHSFQVNNFKQ